MRKVLALMIVFLCVALTAVPVAATVEAPYRGYIYDAWRTPVEAPNGYLPQREVSGDDAGSGAFKLPADLFFHENTRELYVVDSGNNRIVVLDDQLQFKREYESFAGADGTEKLDNPQGVFVTDDGIIYVTDQGNARILVCDQAGTLITLHGVPKSDVIDESFEELYEPAKIVVDKGGRMYIQATGENKGLLSLSDTGEFINYFGSNRVEMTLQTVADMVWKKILTREQRRQMAAFVPIEYSNVCIDQEDFIYAVVKYSANSRDEIKKLNAMGINILRVPGANSFASANYGDLEILYLENKAQDSAFVDIYVDSLGFINVLDATRCKVFQYDEDSNLVFVFGNQGDQFGSLRSPVSLTGIDDQILVLDDKRATITVYGRTAFGKKVRTAMELYHDGRYQEAVGPWNEVLKLCSNYPLAYVGLGKAYYQTEDYAEAMASFRLANDRRNYSDAFRLYSMIVIRDNFTWIVLVILMIFLLPRAIRSRKKIASWFRKTIAARIRKLFLSQNRRADS
jgi:tetratricopeptide (TPR) repeat protein